VIIPSQRPLTTQHATNTRDEHPCRQRDSNFRSQQSSWFRPTPWSTRKAGSPQFCLPALILRNVERIIRTYLLTKAHVFLHSFRKLYWSTEIRATIMMLLRASKPVYPSYLIDLYSQHLTAVAWCIKLWICKSATLIDLSNDSTLKNRIQSESAASVWVSMKIEYPDFSL